MKICMICLGLGNLDKTPLVGGHENTVIRLCKKMSSDANKIVIITTPSIHSNNNQYRIFDVGWAQVHSLPISATYGSYIYGLNFMIKALQETKKINNKEKIDLIHGHSGYPVLGLVTGVVGKSIGVPSIHTLYCPIEETSNTIL